MSEIKTPWNLPIPDELKMHSKSFHSVMEKIQRLEMLCGLMKAFILTHHPGVVDALKAVVDKHFDTLSQPSPSERKE